MYDPISVETALVSSGGDLLIQLSDGNVINAGRVRGNPGPQGEKGEQGIRGAHGKDGIDGTNGAKWHTGVGAPEISLGVNGDLYMDVASALLPIFQKVNGDWMFLANLKVPPSGGGGGQGGAAGGGGSIIIYPKPDGGTPPTNDNDGKPIDKGDIWLDTNTGWLWVYDGTNWLPVGDRPPVSVQPNPPLWNSSGDTNNRYPIVEGDLWFDSDQLALYVAATDTNNNLVWVITIPADRSVLLDEVTTFVFPASSTGTYANDGDTVFNDTTQLWYIYNGSKNQWIDLPPGKNELSLTAILLRGADNFPTTFEYEPADRITYDTDALCYVNADDHLDFTRIVVPFADTTGFDWRTVLRGITVGDQLSLIQIDRGDPNDPDDDFPFRSDYVTVAEIVENGESFNIGLDFQQENPDHLPQFGEEVVIRFKAIINTGDREIIYQENAPDLTTHPNLLEGNLWVDSDDNKMYVWNGSVWSEVTACTGVESGGDFVKKKGGDSMEGPLEITGDRDANAQGIESTLKVYNVDSGRNGDLQLKRNGQTKIWCSTTGITVQGQLKMNVEASKLKSSTNTDLLTFNKNGIFYEGAYSAEKHIATKANVDELSNQIIELEEEIDAIAPAVERGSWEFTLSGTISGPGKLTAYDEYVATSGNATGLVTNIQSLWFHSIDNAGTPHGFDNVEAGNLLELFVDGSPEFGLFTVVEVHDYTAGGGNYWVIDVDFVRTLEQTTRFDNGEVCRLKIFSPPEGGTADGFVLKTGDTMSGNLAIEKDGEASLTLSGKQQGTGNPVSALRFNSRNDTSLQYDGYLTYSSSGTSDDGYFKFNRKIYFTYKNLLDVGHIQMGNNKAIKENTATRIKLNNKVEIPRVGDSKEGFTIYGRNNTQLLRVYHEASGTADAVTYSGRQTSNNDLATVKYVKDAVSSGGGFVPDYDWNQNTHSVYSGSELTRKSEYPKVDGDWSIADTDNNYMANFASLDKVGRIGVQPPWGGASSYKAGYAGQIHFGPDTYNTSRPIAIFTVTTQERSGSYFQWYVRLLWCKPGLTVADLDGKSMMPCQGAVYRI